MPDKPDSSENSMIAGISTLRWPILSEIRPLKIANTPQARPSAPTTLPPSCTLKPRSCGHAERQQRRDDPAVEADEPEPEPEQRDRFPLVRRIPGTG